MPRDVGASDALEQELEALAPDLDLSLGGEERRRLLAYLALIQRWNQVYNLTALRDPSEMFSHHLLDCLAVVRPIERGISAQSAPVRILDVGSGAGLPGIVLAILRPEWQVTCIDAVAKKASFIRQAAAELALPNLAAVHGRVEKEGPSGHQRFELITSRAFASLADFTRLTRHLLAENGVWAAMKAHLSNEEREELSSDIEVFHVEQLQVPKLDAVRRLVWLRPSDPPRQ